MDEFDRISSVTKFGSFQSESVRRVYAAYPQAARRRLLQVRKLILGVAAETDGVGLLEETLKWGEPSYVPSESRSGTTIRLDWKDRDPDRWYLFVSCQTKLISIFRHLHPHSFQYQDNRSLSLPLKSPLPTDPLRECIEIALTYHSAGFKYFEL